MNGKKILANIAGTPGYLSWFLGVLSVLAGIAYWLLSSTMIITEPAESTSTAQMLSIDLAGLFLTTLLSFIIWYFIANFARQLVWRLKRYTKVSNRKFQALLMLDLTIAWTLVGIGLFIAGYDPLLIIIVVLSFALVGYASLALEFYLRSLWKLPTR